jgi:hypothetical protein
MSNYIQEQLNDLARRKVPATIKNGSFGWATLMRYQPLIDSVKATPETYKYTVNDWLDSGGCYVFEIGKNGGDVFSANMVKSIEMIESGAIIHLKH